MTDNEDYPKKNYPISLERLDERITWVCKNINDKFANVEKATIVAKREVDRKHAEMNEVREQLQMQAMTFVSKEIYVKDIDYLKEKVEAIGDKILQLERLKGNIEGRMITFGVGGLALLVIIQLIFNWIVKK